MRPRVGRLLALIAVLLATAVAYGWLGEREPSTRSTEVLRGRVIRVVDGDTIEVELASGKRRVRMIGVDTPELHPSRKLDREIRRTGQDREQIVALGRRSSDFTRRHLDGRDVGLELDSQTDDEYGRLLAYVRLADGRLFNALLLQEGYAHILTRPPNVRYAELFLTLEREARAAKRGLWGDGMRSTSNGGHS